MPSVSVLGCLLALLLQDVLNDALVVGEALGLQQQAAAAVAALQQRMDRAKQLVAELPPVQHPKVAFLEWFEPLFPGGHWTPQLIEMAGAQHPLNPSRWATYPFGHKEPQLLPALKQWLEGHWCMCTVCIMIMA